MHHLFCIQSTKYTKEHRSGVLFVMTCTTRLLLVLMAFSPIAGGCSSASRWQIHDAICTCGTNYQVTAHETMLLDSQTGRSWALRWDEQKFYWQQVVVTNSAAISR